MQTGSAEHKAQVCEDLIKTFHENIWKDEMYLIQLEETKGDKRKEIAAIDLKLEAKEFKSKHEGEKAKFVAEQELKQIENQIQAVTQKVQTLWPARIKMVRGYLEKN